MSITLDASVATAVATANNEQNRALYQLFLTDTIGAEELPAPAWGPIGEAVYDRTYSRDIYVRDAESGEFLRDENGNMIPESFWTWSLPAGGPQIGRTREVLAETVRRVVLGNIGFAPQGSALENEALDLFEAMYEFKVAPAGRHWWVTGTPNAYSRNCFAAETEVITSDGIKRIGDIVGQPVNVIDGHGGWVAVSAKSFGVQKLMKLTLSRQGEVKEVFATADHGWFVAKKMGTGVKTSKATTATLKAGDKLSSIRPKCNPRTGGDRLTVSPVGIQAGFVFGDGSRAAYPAPSIANFCGDKDAQMLRWFPNFEIKSKANGVTYVNGLPRSFKDLPPMNEAPSYLYGWLAGYFAADGSVHPNGNVRLSSAKRENLLAVRDIAARLGIVTGPITVQNRKGYGAQESDLFTLTLDSSTLSQDFFLIDEHRTRFLDSRAKSSEKVVRRWTVVSVEETDRVEEVYCFEVPTTHSFALEGNILTSNCWASGYSARTSSHVSFLARRLFEGGGVGGNYSRDLTSVTTPINGTVSVAITCRPDHDDFEEVKASSDGLWIGESGNGMHSPEVFHVHDSREGWVEAWCHLIDTATQPGEHEIVFDLSGVRRRGAVLKTFGGKASGPGPLAKAIVGITAVLRAAHGRRLRGMDFMAIDHEVAMSVVAGGTRRSARMSLMHWDDPDIFDFISCKADPSQHWTTNISVETDSAFAQAVREGQPKAVAVLRAVAEGMAANGEPGLMNSEAHSVGENTRIRICNPCGEASLEMNTSAEGDAEAESCNLGSVNLEAYGTDFEGALKAFGLVARFLYRATLKPYPDALAAKIEARNRRIGTGFMGLQGWMAAHGAKLSSLPQTPYLMDALTQFRLAARDAADQLADDLGLPRPIKVTAVAPTGSISQLAGTQAGGHPVNAKYFIRRVRYAVTDESLADFIAGGYEIEDDVYAANTKVVSFPTKDAILDRYDEALIESADEISFADFAALTQAIQDTFCGGNDGQAVSATGQLSADADVETLMDDMIPFLDTLKGLTAFPAISRPQSPIEPISPETYEEMVEELDFYAALAGDSNGGSCATGACPIK